jgi:hypothetical protein
VVVIKFLGFGYTGTTEGTDTLYNPFENPEPSRRYLENKLGIAAETAGDSHVLLTGMYAINPFGLPEALTRVILVEWLGLKHVVRLDSAMASRQYSLVTYGQFTTFTVNPDRFFLYCVGPCQKASG